jgi:hypothetical protein
MRDAATIRYEDGDGDEHVVHVRRDDFEDELEALLGNEAFRERLMQENPGLGVTDDDDTVNARVTAIWLTQQIQSVAVQAELDERGVEIDDDDLEAAEESAAEGFFGADVFGEFPESFRRTLVDRQARYEALSRSVAGEARVSEPNEDDARGYFEQNREALTACPSGREVSHILVDDVAAAEEVRGELDAGAAFADVARERSQDPGSAEAGGSLGCLGSAPFVEEFQTAADAAPLGEVVGPVETEFGAHLILVTAWDPTFEKLRDRILAQLRQEAEAQSEQLARQRLDRVLRGWYESFDVDVEPRYGTWSEVEGAWVVRPPEEPEPREGRDDAPETTAPPGAPETATTAPGGSEPSG